MRRHLLPVIAMVLVIGLSAFTVYDYYCVSLPQQSYNYAEIELPNDVVATLSTMDNMDSTNRTSDAGAALGRVLFYDVDLSKNSKVACSSCHLQEFSFGDTAQFSVGFDGGLTNRNSMSLNHARFHTNKNFFWDERASTLEQQALMPIQNTVEMGMTLDTLVARVSAKAIYPPLFEAAFGTPDVDTARIAKALAQFIRSMNTFESKFRHGVNEMVDSSIARPFACYTPEENLGKSIFLDSKRVNCQGCHMQNTFVSRASQNNGLDSVYADNGVGAITHDSTQNGKFRVPSLINIALTGPYMHDGRFKTLDEVIDFYSDSVQNHPNLSRFMRGDTINGIPTVKRPHYTPEEKHALKAFLLTLTDTAICTDERWSNPFCVSMITGVKEVKPIIYSNVYPNPVQAGNSLHLEFIAGSDFRGVIKMYDMQGRVVYADEAVIKTGSNNLTTRNLQLAAGTYILALTKNDKQVFSKKIMIQ